MTEKLPRFRLEHPGIPGYEKAMTSAHWIAACVPLVTGVFVSAGEKPPATEIANGLLRAKVYLPDARSGFYRGTRFDWSGVIQDLEYSGHNFYPQWYERMDPKVVDFTYEGSEIVAGPCTAITGPCEEFSTDGKALGFDEAKTGGNFIKIGVGALRKPDASPYSMFRVYEIVDGGKWIIRTNAESVELRQIISDPSTGYGYDYQKSIALTQGKPQLVLEHTLRNSGKRTIRSSVYNHNFLFLDRQPPSPNLTISLPFPVQAAPQFDPRLAEVRMNRIGFTKSLTGEDRVYAELHGFSSSVKEYDIRIENGSSATGVQITADRPLARLALWSIRAPMCIEPFIDFQIEPGAEFKWRIVYDYFVK